MNGETMKWRMDNGRIVLRRSVYCCCCVLLLHYFHCFLVTWWIEPFLILFFSLGGIVLTLHCTLPLKKHTNIWFYSITDIGSSQYNRTGMWGDAHAVFPSLSLDLMNRTFPNSFLFFGRHCSNTLLHKTTHLDIASQPSRGNETEATHVQYSKGPSTLWM